MSNSSALADLKENCAHQFKNEEYGAMAVKIIKALEEVDKSDMVRDVLNGIRDFSFSVYLPIALNSFFIDKLSKCGDDDTQATKAKYQHGREN
jgi:hypothetical protein